SSVVDEVQPWRPWMRRRSMDERHPSLVEDSEMSDEALERPAISRGGDDRVGLYPAAVLQHHVAAVEAADRGHDRDPPRLQGIDQPHVEDRDLPLPRPPVHAPRPPGPPAGPQVA